MVTGQVTIRPFRLLKNIAAGVGLVIIGAQSSVGLAVLASVLVLALTIEVNFDNRED